MLKNEKNEFSFFTTLFQLIIAGLAIYGLFTLITVGKTGYNERINKQNLKLNRIESAGLPSELQVRSDLNPTESN